MNKWPRRHRPEQLTVRVVSASDVEALGMLADLHLGHVTGLDWASGRHTELARKSRELAVSVGELGLKAARPGVEDFDYIEMNPTQVKLIDKAHELRHPGRVLLATL